MGDISTHFSRSEFACKGKNCCGGAGTVTKELINGLEELRKKVGKPLCITSGFRCVVHNKRVGGAPNSQHIYGTAADVRVPQGVTPKRLAELAEEIDVFRNGGIGIYPTFVHVDVRTQKARW